MFAPFGMGGAFGSSARVEREARADGAEAEAADVEDAAEEEAREDRHAVCARGLVTRPTSVFSLMTTASAPSG